MPGAFNTDFPQTRSFDVAWRERADPFGAKSLFARLVGADGIILYYRATFHYNTVVHDSERLAGGPHYLADEIRRDALALLDVEARRWAEPMVDKLGRAFMIDDVEGPAAQPHSSIGTGT